MKHIAALSREERENLINIAAMELPFALVKDPGLIPVEGELDRVGSVGKAV